VVMTHPVDGSERENASAENCEIVAEVQPKSSKGIHTNPPSVVVHELLEAACGNLLPRLQRCIDWMAQRSFYNHSAVAWRT